VIIILSVLNGILLLLRAATAVYTVYDIYVFQYFASTSPLNIYLEVVRSVMIKYVSFRLYVVRVVYCADTFHSCTSLAYFTVSFHSRISLFRSFTTVERVIVIILAAFSYFLVITDKYNNVYYREKERITYNSYHSAGSN
jgi:hypothetical protein